MRFRFGILFLASQLALGQESREPILLVGQKPAAAATRLREWIETDPTRAEREGWWYLLGHLEELQGRFALAAEAYDRARTTTLGLARRAQLRRIDCLVRNGEASLAWNELRVLVADPKWPREKRDLVLERLANLAVDRQRELPPRAWVGGAQGERWWEWAELRLRASPRSGDDWEQAVRFLRADPADPRSLDLARAWEEAAWQQGNPLRLALWGRVFLAHREHKDAARWLERALALLSSNTEGEDRWELGYFAARARFFLGDFQEAANRFEHLVAQAGDRRRRADAEHQRARSLELAGSREAAYASFQRALAFDSAGPWAGASLATRVRLARQLGELPAAERELEQLASLSGFEALASRTVLGWVALELCADRRERLPAWLNRARRLGADPAEVAYWMARVRAVEGDRQGAIGSYLDAISYGAWSPWAQAARKRLEEQGWIDLVAVEIEARVAAASAQQLAAWEVQLRAPLGPRARPLLEAVARKRAELAEHDQARPFLDLRPRKLQLRPEPRGEELLLLRLGLASEVSEAELELWFPQPTAAVQLELARQLAWGGALRRSIRRTEGAMAKRPPELPLEWVDRRVLELLYATPWDGELEGAAERFGVEPELVLALVREESRFDPRARSSAGAVGLGQFLLSTAREVARRYQLAIPEIRDLQRSEVASSLTAAHLAELLREFGGLEEPALAAYNAGLRQVRAWWDGSGCTETDVFRSLVPFRETRAYVLRILQSRAVYRSLKARNLAPALPD